MTEYATAAGTTNNGSMTFEAIDDGQKPGNTTASTQLVKNLNKASTKFLLVFDGLVSSEWCSRAYKYALEKQRPWGVYVTKAEAINRTEFDTESLYHAGEVERSIAIEYARALIYEKGVMDLFLYSYFPLCFTLAICLSCTGAPHLSTDFDRIHGTVVWCLQSAASDNVTYHIDYAELYRYETNIIHPPLYAGTAHISPRSNRMRGGHFMANMEGLEHYKRFGYKGRLVSEEKLEQDIDDNGDWIRVGYKENRGILHDGDLPHLSTQVDSIEEGKRVILGFNCFTDVVGPCCERAPEHSDAFNRTVKLYQALAAAGNGRISGDVSNHGKDRNVTSENAYKGVKTSPPKAGVSAKDILKKPALAKLLVAAAKKVKAHEEETGKKYKFEGEI